MKRFVVMKYVMPNKLLEFLDFSYTVKSALVIESDNYLEELVKLFPYAKIYFCSSDEYKLKDNANKFADKILYESAAYNMERLPFGAESFDIILGEGLLDENFNPQDIASGLGSFLTPTGYMLTSFSNLLFKPWLDKLILEKRSEFIVRRGYTKEDFERLLVASFFKEVFFAKVQDVYDNKKERAEEEPPFYICRAYKSVYPVREIKSLFDANTRKTLSTLIRRIEFDVNRKSSFEELKKFISTAGIFEDYLKDFIKEACFSPKKVIKLLKDEQIFDKE